MLDGAQVHVVTDKAAKALSDTVTPVGLVAVCSMPEGTLADVLAAGRAWCSSPSEISEPGNAGTLIRLADAMGADAVVLAGHSVDPYNGKCLRASAGSIFALPVLEVTDTAEVIAALPAIRAAGARHDARRRSVPRRRRAVHANRVAVRTGSPWALARASRVSADARVSIPMRGSAESLNVAAAAAICLYQSARAQRG